MASGQQEETEALSSTGCKELNSADNHMSLEPDLSPDLLAIETLALVTSWFKILKDSEAKDPANPCPDSRSTEIVR